MVRICKRRRLDEKESRHYIRQIVSALDHLHAHGVLHRLVCGCAGVRVCEGVRGCARVCGRTGARACTGEHIRAYRRSRRLVCGCANLCAGVRTCVRVCELVCGCANLCAGVRLCEVVSYSQTPVLPRVVILSCGCYGNSTHTYVS